LIAQKIQSAKDIRTAQLRGSPIRFFAFQSEP
jgi:hypothetical protein